MTVDGVEETTAFLLGTTGVGVYYPATTNFGIWAAFESKSGADYQVSRIGVGLSIFFGAR
jgi:hypothetical protein